METNCDYISYESTGSFSKIMLDYVSGDDKLKRFYNYPASLEGIKASIEARKKFHTPRKILVEELRKQYQGITLTGKQEQNLELLLLENTFTLCTAHQPVIFTGPLYFIYKIMHVIKLAEILRSELRGNNFVPVFYMGSEDADLDELGQLHINGEKLVWETEQTGAVGRMKVDKQLISLITRIAGQVEITENGKEILTQIRFAYQEGVTIQQATLDFVNGLFKDYGLLIVIPDNAGLKTLFADVVKKELIEQFSHKIVEDTGKQINKHYKLQASGRDLNLFYLIENKRERIEKEGQTFKVESLQLSWSEEEIIAEVDEHAERFSANVILRGLFQETILPNIAFIGGGGETAYWLELKEVFASCNIPYPMLIVRNSLLLVNEEQKNKTTKLGFAVTDLFASNTELINQLVKRESRLQLSLSKEKDQLKSLYKHLANTAGNIDITLAEHANALLKNALDKLVALEKKMLRAEKRKFAAQQRQITNLKNQLFPNDGLQERVENFLPFYAKYGLPWFNCIYEASLGLEQQFGIVELEK
jgi:bacillithiol biosynthesis cysteine-adding enzyme BshC